MAIRITDEILKDVPSSCLKLGEETARTLLTEWKTAQEKGERLERAGLESVLQNTQNGARMEALWLSATYAPELLNASDVVLLNGKLTNVESEECSAAMLPLNQIAKNRANLITQETVDAVAGILASEKTQANATIVERCLEFLERIKRTEKAELLPGTPLDSLITAAERFKENNVAVQLLGIIGAIAGKLSETEREKAREALGKIIMSMNTLPGVREKAVKVINALLVSRSAPRSSDMTRTAPPLTRALAKVPA